MNYQKDTTGTTSSMHDHYEDYVELEQELDINSVRPELTQERANKHPHRWQDSRVDRVCGGAVTFQPLLKIMSIFDITPQQITS
jgi:hypothetical protein